MKKLSLILAGVAALTSANAGDVRTGFYLGANGALNSFTPKAILTESLQPARYSSHMGRYNVGGGVFAGYGWLANCWWFAGELVYDFKNGRVSNRHQNSSSLLTLRVKNEHAFNYALLIGYKMTPSTVGYVRLGGNWSNFRFHGTYRDTTINTGTFVLSRSVSKASFVPGFGIESHLNHNVKVRVEYSHDFGASIHKVRDTTRISVSRPNTHSTKLGIAWTF